MTGRTTDKQFPDALSELNKITLRDVLTQMGFPHERIAGVMLLLRYKPERVQLAFYYRIQGETQRRISERLGVSQQQVSDYLRRECADIMHYAKSSTSIQL